MSVDLSSTSHHDFWMAKAITHRFGQRIRQLRQQHGWSQEEYGERCSLDRTYISGIERGVRNPSLEVLENLAKGFEMSLSELMSGV